MPMKLGALIFTLAGLYFFEIQALAHDWSVEMRGGKNVLFSQNSEIKATHQMERSPSIPRVCKVEGQGDFEVIVYFWAEVGSGSGLTSVLNGAVYDKKNNKFILNQSGVDFSVYGRFEDGGCGASRESGDQPTWEYSTDGKSLKVEDPESGFEDIYTIE
jgi:hypothetical protein